jgi:hypothetical protein
LLSPYREVQAGAVDIVVMTVARLVIADKLPSFFIPDGYSPERLPKSHGVSNVRELYQYWLTNRRKTVKLIATALLLVACEPAQAQTKWEHTVVPDELHGQAFDVFTLAGEYVSNPAVAKIPVPLMVVLCSKGKMRGGYLKSGFAYPSSSGQAKVDERLDQRKPTSDLITVSGAKWLVDGVGIEGTFTPRGARKIPAKPPLDSLFTDLPLEFPEGEYRAMLQQSVEGNNQLLLHVSGNLSAELVLDAMDASGGKSVWDGHRLRFEHGDGIFPDQFARVRQDGIIVVQNPLHMASILPPGVVAFGKSSH